MHLTQGLKGTGNCLESLQNSKERSFLTLNNEFHLQLFLYKAKKRVQCKVIKVRSSTPLC